MPTYLGNLKVCSKPPWFRNMENLLAKLSDYTQFEHVTDLNTSGEATPSSEDSIFDGSSAGASTSFPARRASSPEGQVYFSSQPADESRQSLPLFRPKQYHGDLELDSRQHNQGIREWNFTGPDTSSGSRDAGRIDAGVLLPEFTTSLASDPYAAGTSSQHQHQHQHQHQPGPSSTGPGQYYAQNLLVECARAIADNDSPRVQNLMWVLNEIASPYGDSDQRLSSYFLQAVFCKITNTGVRNHRILTAAAERTYSFDSLRKMILEYQDASPWTTFGHVAGNGALMEAFEKEMKVHIVDINSTYCTQWPTLLEALATRAEGTPHLRLTTIVISAEESALKVMKQIMTRLERFARLMGVPFEYAVLHQPQLEKLDLATLELRQDEALAINCIQTLHHSSEILPTGEQYSPRDLLLCTFRNAVPKIMIIVEDEVDLVSPDFMTCFCEALRFYSLLFESLEESFPRASNERLMLERTCARNLVNSIACDPLKNVERQEKGIQWDYRLRRVGFIPALFSDDVIDDVRALLKRYKEGWGLTSNDNRLYLTWRQQVVICATAWKPIASPSPES